MKDFTKKDIKRRVYKSTKKFMKTVNIITQQKIM